MPNPLTKRRGLLAVSALGLAVWTGVGAGCEEQEQSVEWIDLSKPQIDQHRLESLTKLQAGPAAVAAHRQGREVRFIFSVRGDGRNDTVYSAGDKGIPRSIGLDVPTALKAAGLSAGTGHFTALLPTEGGLIYYFAGGTDRNSADHVGFLPNNAPEPRVLIDSERLGNVSGLGGTLVLANPQLVLSDNTVTLLLQTPGDAGLVQFDTTDLRFVDGPIRVRSLPLPLVGPSKPFTLRTPGWTIRPGSAADVLLVTDPAGTIYSADFGAGRATVLIEPQGIVAPLPPAQWADGKVVLFVPPTPRQFIEPGREADLAVPWVWLIDGPEPDRQLAKGRLFDVSDFFPEWMIRIDDETYVLHDPSTGVVAKLLVRLPEEDTP